jgi:hypothetical protein
MQHLAGTHTGEGEKAFEKAVPRSTSLSRLGVFISLFPSAAIASARIWSTIKTRTFGFFTNHPGKIN